MTEGQHYATQYQYTSAINTSSWYSSGTTEAKVCTITWEYTFDLAQNNTKCKREEFWY